MAPPATATRGGGCRTLPPLWRALPLATPRVYLLAAAVTLTAAAAAAAVRSKPTASAPAAAAASAAAATSIRVASRGDTIGGAHAALRRGRSLWRGWAGTLVVQLARPPQVSLGPLHAAVAVEVHCRGGGAVGRAQLLHQEHVGHLG